MRNPINYFFSGLILAVLFAAWYVRPPDASRVIAAPIMVHARQSPTQPPTHLPSIQARRTVEMVFVLDTTGSMGGLIDGAKQKIWGIVNSVLKGQMARKVRVGLVAYRDRDDAYVTKLVPLTDDLDKVYTQLMQFQAEGGGDTPEDVRRGLTVAVRQSGWSRKSQDTTQLLFLVGDAPPHDDYQDEPTTTSIVSEARQRGILVDTVQCGDAQDTRHVWQMIASRGQGEFFAIAQDGGVQVTATPYDRELSELGGRMGSTYMPYGSRYAGAGGEGAMKAQGGIEADVAKNAPVAAQAERAVNKAINGSAYKDDLVQQIADGHAHLGSLKTESLPASLAGLAPADRNREVQKLADERKALQAKILDLSKQRDSYLQSHSIANSRAGFDGAVSHALAAQIGHGGSR